MDRKQMIGGTTAFQAFKRLARGLRELGYEVREQDEFAEFSMNGFVCSFRYFGVLDVDFLKPGQKLLSKGEPDVVCAWDGAGWRDVTDEGVLEVSRSNEELFNRCLKRLNYDIGASIGFFPNICILVPPV